MSASVNIICLNWGNRYPDIYVNNLYRSLKKYLHRPFRFVCVTDKKCGFDEGVEYVPIPENPGVPRWPHVFLKLLITADGFADLVGPTLFLDIDIVIKDDVDCFFEYMPGKNVIIHNWLEPRKTLFRKAPDIGNSSVFRFEAGRSQYICDTFIAEREQALDGSLYPTEQAFLTYAMREHYWWPEPWVRSFKRHCMRPFPLNYLLPPSVPAESRILVFHGRPDPSQIKNGYKGTKIHHYVKPAAWIDQFWPS